MIIIIIGQAGQDKGLERAAGATPRRLRGVPPSRCASWSGVPPALDK